MEPIKILYTTDWHLCSRCPGKRSQDDFFDLQMKKVDEIIKLSVDNKVSAIIHGGDFFDSPKIDYWLLNSIISKFQILEGNGIAVYLVPGSHDMYGYNVTSIHSTAVGALEATGLISVLNGYHRLPFFNVVAIPATLQHNSSLYSSDSIQSGDKSELIISHNTITPVPVPYSHILLKDIPGSGRIYLLGHYHSYFMCKENDNIFVNTGPLVRTDISEKEHAPCVVLLTYADNKIKNIKKLILGSARQNVFLQEDVNKQSFDFVNSIRTTTFQYCDLFDLTKQIGKASNISQDTINDTITRLEKVQRELA